MMRTMSEIIRVILPLLVSSIVLLSCPSLVHVAVETVMEELKRPLPNLALSPHVCSDLELGRVTINATLAARVLDHAMKNYGFMTLEAKLPPSLEPMLDAARDFFEQEVRGTQRECALDYQL